MSLGGNLLFFGSVILILDVLLFSGFFPSESLNDPTMHEPWVHLPVVGTLSFVGVLTLFLTIFGSIILLVELFQLKEADNFFNLLLMSVTYTIILHPLTLVLWVRFL